ncbi:RNA polymerase ECF-type sigma factor [Plesiocystis pacifica SIR-1]|uniref:RNA polymerase ECF-type sigma factor n=1 Tax=Plesiocystis pacifica SIR-1 TaxID=391625 RepID=A6G9C2_9BACT|nr:RNA polymerase sigma factor [Plesiocystis pacifica]EDM77544.1 RNA polymerase ECF-type sigma factor [Plesiocystis pacifica SIR-1]
MTMTGTIEERATRAVEGDAAALESVLREVRDDVYGLALRMLGHLTDAEDVSQEALIRIATQLAKFEGRSKFRTWAWRRPRRLKRPGTVKVHSPWTMLSWIMGPGAAGVGDC